jgi:SAM-dependent methyltransferase
MERKADVKDRLGAIAARCIGAALAACVAVAPLSPDAIAEPLQTPKPPVIGQDGKDAIWVPTPDALITLMFDLAKVTPDDTVVDLGSGDGRAVIAAAKRGARARGIEYDANLVAYSNIKAKEAGVADRATFVRGDLFEADFSDADVVVLFLLPDMNIRLRPKILKMKPGTRVVSNTFGMDGWYPDGKATLEGECQYFFCDALLWVVPAQIAGVWRFEAGGKTGTLSLKQDFQFVGGTMTIGDDVNAPIADGRLLGDKVTFTAGGIAYHGTVRGDTIEGKTGSGTPWQAKRGV